MSEKYKFHDPYGIYFTTSTVVFWIDLFTRPIYKHLIIDSLRFCQEEKGLIIHSWCLMPSHLHMIVSSNGQDLSSIFADFKKYTSKQIIKLIKESNESRAEWCTTNQDQFYKALKSVKIKNTKPTGSNASNFFTTGGRQGIPSNLNIENTIDFFVNDVAVKGYSIYKLTY